MTTNGMYKLKAVLIDFGDTIAYIDENVNKKYHQALFSVVKRFGFFRDLKTLRMTFENIIWNSMKGEFKDLSEFWEQFAVTLGLRPSSTLIRNLEKVRVSYSSTIFKLYSGAISALAALKIKYKMALVSNCAIGTSDVIKALGLKNYFRCIILSYEVGVRKPHKQIYLEALKCTKLKPHECIFVADEISDLEGARQVGMKTFLICQGIHTYREAKNQDFQPTLQCNSISELQATFRNTSFL